MCLPKTYVAFALCLFASSSFAQLMLGTELRQALLAEERLQSVSVPDHTTISLLAAANKATAYVRGVADSLWLSGPCVPPDATPGQLVAIVRKYINENPQFWNEPAVAIVRTALREAFQCNK